MAATTTAVDILTSMNGTAVTASRKSMTLRLPTGGDAGNKVGRTILSVDGDQSIHVIGLPDDPAKVSDNVTAKFISV